MVFTACVFLSCFVLSSNQYTEHFSACFVCLACDANILHHAFLFPRMFKTEPLSYYFLLLPYVHRSEKKTRKDLFLSFKVINTVGIYSKYWVLSEGIKFFLLMHWFTIDTFYGFLSVRASLSRGLTSFRAKVQRLGKSKQAAHAWCCWIVSAQTVWLQKNHFLGTPFQDHKRLHSIFARQCDRC